MGAWMGAITIFIIIIIVIIIRDMNAFVLHLRKTFDILFETQDFFSTDSLVVILTPDPIRAEMRS